LDLSSLAGAEIFSYGGFGGTREQLAREYFGHAPSDAELRDFDQVVATSSARPGDPWWLSEQGTLAVLM
jgi:hypothetical protein